MMKQKQKYSAHTIRRLGMLDYGTIFGKMTSQKHWKKLREALCRPWFPESPVRAMTMNSLGPSSGHSARIIAIYFQQGLDRPA